MRYQLVVSERFKEYVSDVPAPYRNKDFSQEEMTLIKTHIIDVINSIRRQSCQMYIYLIKACDNINNPHPDKYEMKFRRYTASQIYEQVYQSTCIIAEEFFEKRGHISNDDINMYKNIFNEYLKFNKQSIEWDSDQNPYTFLEINN